MKQLQVVLDLLPQLSKRSAPVESAARSQRLPKRKVTKLCVDLAHVAANVPAAAQDDRWHDRISIFRAPLFDRFS